MPKPVTIAGTRFATQVAAERHAQAILHAGVLRTLIEPEHWPFLEALLLARPVKVAELAGREVVGFVRDRQPHEHSNAIWTINFWAVLDDGGRLDFSIRDSIKALADSQRAGGGS